MNVAIQKDFAGYVPMRSETLTEARGSRASKSTIRLEDAEATWRQLEAENALMTPYQRSTGLRSGTIMLPAITK